MDCTRKEAAKRQHETLARPRRAVQQFAAADGERAQQTALKALHARNYARAKDAFDEASTATSWAGARARARAEPSLNALAARIRVGEAANRGDSILEAIAAALKPIYAKDYTLASRGSSTRRPRRTRRRATARAPR